MKENNKIFIGLGSNMGDRKDYLGKAIGGIEKFAHVINKSSVYETDPVGYKNQGRFLNMVVEIVTDFDPKNLHDKLKQLEKTLGRGDSEMRFGPREIDLDILLYGNKIIDEEGLKVPHPRMSEREFVLEPLNEIDPFVVHPQLNKTIHELWIQIKSKN